MRIILAYTPQNIVTHQVREAYKKETINSTYTRSRFKFQPLFLKKFQIPPPVKIPEIASPVATTRMHGSCHGLHTIEPIPAEIEQIPATRYYGSKRRLLGWLYSKLKNLEFETVLDPFGGTACVSQMFRAMRKKVTYHDAFCFNFDVATTVLADTVALSKDDLVKRFSAVNPTEGLISRHFKDIFYTEEENSWLDGFIAEIRKSSRSENETSLLLYLLYQACLKKRPFNLFHRANLRLRTNRNVNRSFGNLVTWEKPFSDHMIKAHEELLISRITSASDAIVLAAQNATDLKSGYDLVYIDPPYVNPQEYNNRDDYWRKYHFLEGLSSYDDWEQKIDFSSDICLMPAPVHFAVWSRKAIYKDILFDLVRRHKSSIVVLSYVACAYPSETDITKHFKLLFAEVLVHSIEHTHALSHSKKRELLFVGLPK